MKCCEYDPAYLSGALAPKKKKSLMASFGLGDVEEEGDATDGVHDEDLGKHDADDAGGEAVVNQDPVDRRNNL